MDRKAQLLWDFRGPNAKMTAQHHLVHLKEFAQAEQISEATFNLLEHSPMFFSAAMVVNITRVTQLRVQLKPNRGKQI